MKSMPAPGCIQRAVPPAILGLLIAVMPLTLIVGGCASPWPDESAELAQQDTETALRIKAALIEEPSLAGAAIDVAFSGGRARMTGFVETAKQRRTAERVARKQEGVASVVNEIVVK